MPEPKRDREDHKKKIDASKEGSVLEDVSGHLNELRDRILVSIFIVLALFLVAFNFSEHLMIALEKAAPQGSSFFQLKPGELFFSSIKVSFCAAFVVALPLLLYQLNKFLSPALKREERKAMLPIMILAPILFFLGIIFAYYLALPPLLKFLLKFKDGVVESRYGLEAFINLELSIIGLCAVSFQLPIFLFILASFGLITSSQLLAVWRYAILSSFIVAAIITPTPDPITMTILALALLALYFFTYLILRLIKK